MTQEDFIPIVEFIEKHWLPATVWENGALLKWLCWAASLGFLMQVLNDEEETMGLVIARPVKELPNGNDSAHDPDGQIIFVDLAIAPTKPIQKILGFAILHQFGERSKVAFKRNEKVKIHDMAKVRRALLRN